jgi:hypothetical protein
LFDGLDSVNKTGILFHELLLEDYLKYGDNFKRNSQGKILTDPIRYLNYLIVSDFYENKNRNYEYLKFLHDRDLLYFDQITFNFQGHLFEINKKEFESQYPVITATHLYRYRPTNEFDYLEVDYLDSFLRGRTRFSIHPGSTLTLALDEHSLKQAKILGGFEIHSSIFQGRTTQTLLIRNSNEAYIKFYQGRVASELKLNKNSELYCKSRDYDDDDVFSQIVDFQKAIYELSSSEYIKPCGLIRRLN